jgi:hypothetical protein
MKNIALPHKYSHVADYVTMSIGIATSEPNNILTPQAIIRQAHSALYVAKKQAKTHIAYIPRLLFRSNKLFIGTFLIYIRGEFLFKPTLQHAFFVTQGLTFEKVSPSI